MFSVYFAGSERLKDTNFYQNLSFFTWKRAICLLSWFALGSLLTRLNISHIPLSFLSLLSIFFKSLTFSETTHSTLTLPSTCSSTMDGLYNDAGRPRDLPNIPPVPPPAVAYSPSRQSYHLGKFFSL